MPKILRVVTLASATGRYGGPFDTATRQMLLASEMGFDTVLFAGYLPGDMPNSNRSEGISTNFVPTRNFAPRLGFAGVISFRAILELTSSIRRSDVVHISIAREMIPLLALIISRISHKRCVIQSHGMLTSRTSFPHRIIDILLRPLVRGSSAIIALTSVEANALKNWIGRSSLPICVLGNPVPRGLMSKIRGRPITDRAIFIARLHKRKRVDVFLAAAGLSAQESFQHEFVVVGPDGGDLEMVTKACDSLPNATYEGPVSPEEVSRRVANAGVFVLTSESEPWGNVLAIALASGVPVVVSESAALSGLIENYRAGIVIGDGDAARLSQVVHEILSDDKLYERLSAGATKLASSELDEEHQRRVLGGLYEDACA